MNYEVDKHIEGIYIDILRKMLENPDDWKKGETIVTNRSFLSPYINEEELLRFITLSRILSCTNCSNMEIYKGTNMIHQLEIPWTDFKTRRLLRKFFKHKDNDEKAIQKKIIDEKSDLLKKSLGPRMERFIKLSKIRKKL